MLKTIRKITLVLTAAEKKRVGLLLLLDILISIADILFLAVLLFLIHIYTEPSRTVPGQGTKISYWLGWLTGRDPILGIAVFFLLFSVKNLGGFLIYRAQSRYLFQVASRISRNKLANYLEGTYSGYINIDSSVQIREINYNPLEFCQHVLGGMQQIITQVVLIGLAIVSIVLFNAKLFLLLFTILLPPIFAVFYLIKGKIRAVRKNAGVSSERSLQYLQEALSGYVESNIYDKNEIFLERYMTYQQQFNKMLSDQAIIQGIPNRMIEIFALLGVVILIAINKWAGNGDGSAIITIGVFMAAAYKIIPGIVKILSLGGQINTYSFTLASLLPGADPVGGMKINGSAGEKLPGQNAKSKKAGEMASGSDGWQKGAPAGEVDAAVRSIEFNDVRFSYGDRLVLDNQHLQLAAGDFLGISGPSGRGKTTILHLLLGFLTPAGGSILMNGTITETGERRGYWKRTSYVKQQSFLIHDTLLQNITFDSETCDEQKLQEVLTLSGLAEVVDRWPEKWNKVIAENGKNISGGQKQRIAIARALYKDADLIILDEPFNELDEVSEKSLLSYFQQLAKNGKMVILITHNKQSLSFCNKIISLDESPA